ncbi:MAG TPA: LysR family transcriptional regulator [Frankiaceae bacterium]|jgi:DNA-binding transcriptional LysR family regulator|nr:LysR family transcriptional regulator [Frankiaceae bacterium]
MTGRPRLDLVRQIEYFLAVVDEGHFGRAAQRLSMSQPPLSQGIQRLERLLGGVLFVRGPRGAELTSFGAGLVPRARQLLAAAKAVLQPEPRNRQPVFRLAVVPQLPRSTAAALVEAVRSQHQHVAVKVLPTSDSTASLGDGELDAAVVIHPALLPQLDAGPVIRLPRDMLVPGGHPLAGVPSLPLRSLAGTPLALEPRRHGPAAFDLVADLVGIEGVRLAPAAVTGDQEALLAVAGGDVMALTADPSLHGRGVARVALEGDPLPLRLRVAWPANRPPGALADAMTAAMERP